MEETVKIALVMQVASKGAPLKAKADTGLTREEWDDLHPTLQQETAQALLKEWQAKVIWTDWSVA